MRISEQWLREWISTRASREELSHQLTMAGVETDPPQPVCPDLENLLTGTVLAVEPHPDADKLRICQVDVGQPERLCIVCGAPNVKPGMQVVVAPHNSRIHGGQKIKRSKIRGIASEGMLCSQSELGLEESSEGLMELPADTQPGQDIRQVLGLDDHVFEFDLTPNRGDCLSVAGIARELRAVAGVTVTPPAIPAITPLHDKSPAINLPEPQRCSRYAGRIISGFNPKAKTPLWLRERLRRSGVRSLGPVVDVTNYVMLELGQPLHAFDYTKLSGPIQVRSAQQGETLRLLNEQSVTLTPDFLVITDKNGPVALAGIMGGHPTRVDSDTDTLLLESAWFPPQTIAGRARRLGIPTDASHRFERGVDPNLQAAAIERATALIVEIAGGEPGPLVDHLTPEHPRKKSHLSLRPSRVNAYLGTNLQNEEIEKVLRSLDMDLGWLSADQIQVSAPSYRFDIEREEDLIEEIARIHGYQNIAPVLPRKIATMEPHPDTAIDPARLKTLLVGKGYSEVITYSFIDPALQQLLDPETDVLRIENPLSSAQSVMRTSLWPGLLDVVRSNQRRQQASMRIFEVGRKFSQSANKLLQDTVVSGIICGEFAPGWWGDDKRLVDFYDLKADVEQLVGAGNRPDKFAFRAERHPALHPGQSAQLLLSGQSVGWLGSLHPNIAKELDLAVPVQLFELELAALTEGVLPEYREASRFPSVRRDLAVVVEQSVTADTVLQCCRDSAGKWLQDLWLFDQYKGEGIPNGFRSIGLAFVLQAQDRTLTDKEVDSVMDKVITNLDTRVGGRLRES